MESFLAQDVLDSGLNVAQLIVAVVSLGGGGFVGGAAGAVARMRTEERQKLWKELSDLPDVLLSPDEDDGFIEHLHQMCIGAALLSWPERAAFRRAVEAGPFHLLHSHVQAESQTDMWQLMAEFSDGEEATHAKTMASRWASKRAETGKKLRRWRDSAEAAAWYIRLSRVELLVLARIQPTLVMRIRNLASRIRLAATGSWINTPKRIRELSPVPTLAQKAKRTLLELKTPDAP